MVILPHGVAVNASAWLLAWMLWALPGLWALFRLFSAFVCRAVLFAACVCLFLVLFGIFPSVGSQIVVVYEL